MRIAYDFDPLSLIIREGCGYVHMLRRDYSSALAEYRELADMDPGFYKGYSSMGRVYSLLGQYDLALTALQRARELGGPVASILSAMGQTLAIAGREPEARAMLDELHSAAAVRYVPATSFAIIHLGLGEHSRALTYLEQATEQREMPVTALKVHPLYDPLRSEPRFEKLLERIGLLP